MGLLSFIGDIFSPATKLIDDLHVSDAEKMELRNQLADIQAKAQAKLISLEEKRLEAHSKIVVAEMSSSNKLASSWRPLSSLSLVILVILGSFGIVEVSKDLYSLLEILLGTYAGSRGLEKIASTIKLGSMKKWAIKKEES